MIRRPSTLGRFCIQATIRRPTPALAIHHFQGVKTLPRALVPSLASHASSFSSSSMPFPGPRRRSCARRWPPCGVQARSHTR